MASKAVKKQKNSVDFIGESYPSVWADVYGVHMNESLLMRVWVSQSGEIIIGTDEGVRFGLSLSGMSAVVLADQLRMAAKEQAHHILDRLQGGD